MKKGLLCYYSTSSVARKAADYLKQNLKEARFELWDMGSVSQPPPDLSSYDIVGFALAMEHDGIPEPVIDFVAELAGAEGQDAFLLDAGGSPYGYTLFEMASLVKEAGFKVVSGYSLPDLPERGKVSKEELGWFDTFISNLNSFLSPSHS